MPPLARLHYYGLSGIPTSLSGIPTSCPRCLFTAAAVVLSNTEWGDAVVV